MIIMSWLCTQIELGNFANFSTKYHFDKNKMINEKKTWRLLAGHKMDVLKILARRWIKPDKAKVTMEYKKCRKLVAPFLSHLSVTLNPYLWTQFALKQIDWFEQRKIDISKRIKTKFQMQTKYGHRSVHSVARICIHEIIHAWMVSPEIRRNHRTTFPQTIRKILQ